MLHQPTEQFQPASIVPALTEDAALLALAVELDAATAEARVVEAKFEGDVSKEADAIVSAAFDAEIMIIRQIEALPASTLAGLRVKATALSRCHSDEPIDDSFFCLTDDAPTTDLRLAAGILRDLLNIAAAE